MVDSWDNALPLTDDDQRASETFEDFLFQVAVKNSYAETSTPGINDDRTLGYVVGSEWLDTTGPTFYKCSNNAEGAATWEALN